MSYGRELAEEMMIDEDIFYFQHLSRIMQGMWTKKDGTQISIHDMQSSHILNCLSMLAKRDDDIAYLWKARFLKELEDRVERC